MIEDDGVVVNPVGLPGGTRIEQNIADNRGDRRIRRADPDVGVALEPRLYPNCWASGSIRAVCASASMSCSNGKLRFTSLSADVPALTSTATVGSLVHRGLIPA